MRASRLVRGSLRLQRPYWMLFKGREVDNWQIYTQLDKPEHQRIEMAHQAWLGGLDRPYMRPRCTVNSPLWLERKRHQLRLPDLQGPETSVERYVLQWEEKFHSFRGTLRPTADDMHIAFELVERPLDLSYALQIVHWCRNEYDIHFAADSFTVLLEACLRVDRKDVAKEALANADLLGFWNVEPDVRRYLDGEQTWYRRTAAGLHLPESENVELNSGATSRTAAEESAAEEAKLAAELEVLEAKEPGGKGSSGAELDDEEARLLAELEALEADAGDSLK